MYLTPQERRERMAALSAVVPYLENLFHQPAGIVPLHTVVQQTGMEEIALGILQLREDMQVLLQTRSNAPKRDRERAKENYILAQQLAISEFVHTYHDDILALCGALETPKHVSLCTDHEVEDFFFDLLSILALQYGEDQRLSPVVRRFFLATHDRERLHAEDIADFYFGSRQRAPQIKTPRLLFTSPKSGILWGQLMLLLAQEPGQEALRHDVMEQVVPALEQLYADNLRRLESSAQYTPEDLPQHEKLLVLMAYCMQIEVTIRQVSDSTLSREQRREHWSCFLQHRMLFSYAESLCEGDGNGEVPLDAMGRVPEIPSLLARLQWLLQDVERKYYTSHTDDYALHVAEIFHIVEHLRLHILTELVFVFSSSQSSF